MGKSSISVALCLFFFKIIHASMIELGLTDFSLEPPSEKLPVQFNPICLTFKTLYEDVALLNFCVHNQNIHGFFLALERTKNDSLTLTKVYRKFYTYTVPRQPADYKYLLDTFTHAHKILELISTAINEFLKVDVTEEYSKPLQDFYAEAQINWQTPLENLSYIIYDHVATLNKHYNLDPDDLILCARLQQVLARSPARFEGYALDYD